MCYSVHENYVICGDSTNKVAPLLHQKLWGCSSAWLERLPVTQEAAGSSPVTPAKIMQILKLFLFLTLVIITVVCAYFYIQKKISEKFLIIMVIIVLFSLGVTLLR